METAFLQVGKHLAALEVDDQGEPCVVFVGELAGDLDVLLTVPGHVLTELGPGPVTLRGVGGSAVELTEAELNDLCRLYGAGAGMLGSYLDWLSWKSDQGGAVAVQGVRYAATEELARAA